MATNPPKKRAVANRPSAVRKTTRAASKGTTRTARATSPRRSSKPKPSTRASLWTRLTQDDTWGWYTLTVGVVLQTVGLGVDTLLHRLDPKIPLHDPFSFINPWHTLLVIGVGLILLGVSSSTVISARRDGVHIAVVLGVALFIFGLVVGFTALSSRGPRGFQSPTPPAHGHDATESATPRPSATSPARTSSNPSSATPARSVLPSASPVR